MKKRKSSKYVNHLGAYKYVKRFLDIVGSLLALILFSPGLLDPGHHYQEPGRRISLFRPRTESARRQAF
jgi:hypothetical protein